MLQLRNASISIQLILLLVCVILTWGVAATLVFNLVDYKGMAGKFLNFLALVHMFGLQHFGHRLEISSEVFNV